MKNLRKVVFIRHGSYNNLTNQLNSVGIREIKSLRIPLKTFLEEEGKILLLSSSAPRAKGSAEIISKGLRISYESSPLLWSDADHPQYNSLARRFIVEKIEEQGAEVLIIMSHLEYVNELPKRLLGDVGNGFIPNVNLKKGEMVMIDLINKTTTFSHS